MAKTNTQTNNNRPSFSSQSEEREYELARLFTTLSDSTPNQIRRVQLAASKVISDEDPLTFDAYPVEAPELYQPKSGPRTENVIAFIRRVYGPYLDGRFTRGHLRRLDEKCYNALRRWLLKNDMPADMNLPKSKERYQAVMDTLTDDQKEAILAHNSTTSARSQRKRRESETQQPQVKALG